MGASAVLLLLALSGATAGPAQRQANDKCSTRCPDMVKFKYEPGWSYEYHYEAETRTTMAGAAKDIATITISATAKIEVLEPCEMALRLTDVVVKRSHEENPKRMIDVYDMSRARTALESQSLHFAFYDGKVGDLCPDLQEELWALNVKRGILSSFQNSMHQMEREEHVQEADVTGRCPTHYKVTQQGWKSLTVTKAKDILACTGRYDYQTSLTSVPYSAANSLQSLPLMKSSHECTQDIGKEEGIVQRSTCHEVHVFRPFSKGNSGAVTEASHTLTFHTKAAGVRSSKGPDSRRTTLLFEHKQGASKGASDFVEVKNKLEEICDITKVDIRPQVPRVFAELVHMMRSLDYSDLQDLSRQIERNRICQDNAQKSRKLFLDALPMVATGASLRLMANLLMSEEVKDIQATFWLTSMAFISNPTKDMISAVEPLLRDGKRQQDAMLAVSSLVNNYCEQHEACTLHQEALQVVGTLIDILGPVCHVDDNNLRQVLLALRAIGNIGRFELASPRVEKCFTQNDLPMDVRIAALDAYRRMPCSADRNNVMELFLRHKEDSELRIAAYLRVMQCPSDIVLTQVRQALLDEKVNQVGSFIWTHLTNLLETDSPHKQAIREILENELLQKEFNKDRRKFSHNTEISYFSERFNVGGSFESNTIWSSSSFIPRSAMLNLTVDMFGHSVNLLELGGRVQGLEYLLQAYFSPDTPGKEGGYGQNDAIKNLKLVRSKANFGKVKDDLRGQMYLRIFGNELAYGLMDGSSIKNMRQNKADSFFEDLMKKLMTEGEVSFSKSAVLFDTTIIIPTVAGLPLNLTVNGTAALDLQASQKMDFKKINAKSKAFEVAAMLQPSGAVEVASMMSVDAFVTQVGLKMTSRLHTSTAIKGRMELARGQILSVEIDTPRDTLEIFDFQSRFFMVHDTHMKEQQMIRANHKEKSCSGAALANVVGMELCASSSFPDASAAVGAPYFPFTGPTSISLALRKNDVHLGYRLLAKQIKTSSSMITQVALDTPGSKVDRAISIGYVVNLKAKTLEADLLSPWKKVSAKMSWERNKKLHRADAAITVDTDKKYTLLAQMDRDIRISKEIVVKLKPFLEVKSADNQLMSVKGSMDYKENKMARSTVVIEMKDTLKKPISVDYTLVMKGRDGKTRYKNSLKLSSQFATVKSSLQAFVGSFTAQKKAPLLKLRSRMDYHLHSWPSIKRNIVTLGLKLHDRSTAALRKYGVNMNFDSKRSPGANLLVNGEVSHKKTLTKVQVNIRHGKNIKLKADKNKALVLAGIVAHKVSDPQAVVSFDFKAIYPDMAIEYQLKGKHEHSKRSLEEYLTLRYAKGKGVDAHMRLSQAKKKRSATFDLSYPAEKNYAARSVKINADLTEKGPDHHVLSALVSPQKGEKHSFVVSYKQPTHNSVEISSDVNMHKRKPIKLDLSGNLALQDMKGQGKLIAEGKTYLLTYASDIQKDKYANLTVTVVHPDRRMELLIEGGRDTQEVVKRGKMQVLWDADNDPSQKMGVTVEMADKINVEDLNFGGMFEVFTPFDEYQHMKGELRLENSHKRVLAIAETVLGNQEKEYSAKFSLSKPVTRNSFQTQVWLKSPHVLVRHVELKADHSFEESGRLSTALKGTLNRHTVQMGVSGSRTGDLVVRKVEALAFFKSTLQGAEHFRLTFNHRDSSGRYNSQAVLDANGDQYSAIMEANVQKVEYMIDANGEISIRAPQLVSPVTVGWKHKNNLHELASSLTVDLPQNKQVHLEVDAKSNVVTKEYEAEVLLRGPWKENGSEHISKLKVNFATVHSGYDLSANLQLDGDTYDYHKTQRQTNVAMESTTSLKMSRFPQYNYQHKSSIKYADFPYMVSIEVQVAKKPMLNLDVEIENPKANKYLSTSRIVFALEDAMQNIAISTEHEKKRSGQWITRGDIEYEIGKKISFSSVVDVDKRKKVINMEMDTPFDEARNIRLEYTHSGNIKEDFMATCSLSVDPLFNTVETKMSWSNQDRFRGNLRVDTPFKELRHAELKTESWKEGNKRHAMLAMEYSPKQLYKLDTVYSYDFPHGMDIELNMTTPHRELPSLHSHIGYQYSEADVATIFKVSSPALQYDELSFSFSQRKTPKSLSAEVDTVIGSWNAWSSHAEVSWDPEIEGLFSVENNGEGRQKVHLLLSHKGHTWEDFRTKASFKLNGDRLESEVAYSNRDGQRGSFMLATPDPDIDFFQASFFKRLTKDKFEGRFTVQYGEASKPYDLGLMTTYSDDMIAFSTDLKTPHTEDFGIEIGFAQKRRVEIKLLAIYGANDKLNFLVKYNIRREFWNAGGEFEYMVQGSGRNIGFEFKRDGPLDNLKCSCTAKYMGKEVSLDTHFQDGEKKTGLLEVRSNFEDYTNLAASFNHSGNNENFQTTIHLRYKDDKEARGTIDFQRNKWKRVTLTTTLNLPLEEFQENKLTYKHINRKNKVSAEGSLKLGAAQAINGKVDFVDNEKLIVSVTGPDKHFRSFTATGSYDKADKKLEGDAVINLSNQPQPITATYMVRAGIWPVMVNVKAQTPFEGWEIIELTSTHDGVLTDFTSSYSLTAEAVGTIQSEMLWAYTSPSSLTGDWTWSSSVEGAENLKLSLKNTQSGNEYVSHLVIGWELMKEIVVDTNIQLGDRRFSNGYKGSIAMTSPLPEASQLSVSFDHSHDDNSIQDSVVAHFNDQKYLDADFLYNVGDRRVGTMVFRKPRPMEFKIGGEYTENKMDGELKLNWDKRDPEKNIHLMGDYTDYTDRFGTDTNMKVWVVHPTRTMGMEYLMKRADKEFQNDFLLTWDKASGHTFSYVINWTDRSSRYSSVYDAMVKVGVPMRSVQVDGMYSNTGRVNAAEGSIMWDADRDKNMKVGMKGQLDSRGNTNKMQLGLALPFVSKEYSLTTEATVNTGNTVLDARTEFSYSMNPSKLLVVTSRIDKMAIGDNSNNYSLALGLVHPATDLDIQTTSHVGHSGTGSSVGTHMAYTTSGRAKKTIELRGHVDKLRRVMGIELKTPVKNLALEGELSGDREHSIVLVKSEDGQRSQVADMFINPETRTFEMTFWYDKGAPSNTVKLFGHVINDKLLQTDLYRMERGQRVSETLMTVRLNTSRILHTRINWRPDMFRDLQQYVGTQLTLFSYGSSQAFQSVAQDVGKEVGAKYKAIMQEIQGEVRPLFEHFQRGMEALQVDLDLMQTNLRRFYFRNALHVKDINSATSDFLESMVMGLQKVVLQFRQLQTSLQQDLTKFVQEMGQYPMAQRYAQLVHDFAGGLKNSRVVVEQALDVLSKQIAKLSDLTYRKYLLISRQIDSKLQGYTQALQQNPQFQGLKQAYGSVPPGLGQLSFGNYKQLADAANATLMKALDNLGLKDTYLAIVTKSKQLIGDQFQDLVMRPEFQRIYVIGNEIYQQGIWAYHYWHVEKNMHMAVSQFLELAKDVTLLEIARIKNAVVDLDKSRVITFDPKHGELQFEIYLPVSMKSLAEPPDLRVGKYINRLRSWAASYIPSPRHSLWTYINSYLPNLNTDTWLPPFTAHAFVLGDQHMVTFDQKHYNFAGRCSFILARDMADDRFTVIVRYNNRPRRPQVQSIIILLRGVSIEVDRENKVKVNNKETELPFFTSGIISAVRQRSVISVKDGEALTVEIDHSRSIYSVALSGWYHGRTAGLLGTFDNEPFNDLMDSNHQITNDVDAFTNSWEVSRRNCRSKNLADVEELDSEAEAVQACQKFLTHSSSYFSPCFNQVEAKELVGVCASYVKSGISVEEAKCKAGQQYRYMCGQLGVRLATPAECVSCGLPGMESLGVGKEVVQKPSDQEARSADVVFVVEESSCNAWAQQSLPSIATHLLTALERRGLTANRFGLVSYSGNSFKDQHWVRTIEGQVFGEPSNFLKATENLRLMNPGQPGNADAAVREAMTYPFRVGVAKLLVLLPCSACTGDLYALEQVLISHGFKLHVLRAQNFTINGLPSSDRIFGVDNWQAYTPKSVSKNSDEIFHKLDKPGGGCARLAFSTNGSVFDVSHMQARNRIQKEFLGSFASQSAMGAKPPRCEICSCYDDGDGQGRTVCRLCGQSGKWNYMPAWLRSSSNSVMGIVNNLHYQIITSLDARPAVANSA